MGLIRLDLSGYSGRDSLEPVAWEEWLEKFDESGLALLVQDETAGEERSNFNKLIKRENAGESKRPSRGAKGGSRRRAA